MTIPGSDLQIRPAYQRYGAAVTAMVAALGLSIALTPILGTEAPFMVFFLAIAFSAWHGGFAPGLVTTILSGVAAIWIRTESAYSFAEISTDTYASLTLFMFQGVLVSYLFERMNRSQRHIAGELEKRVEERTSQLNSTIRELEAFSYSVSHDLRAPLRAIDGFTRMLQEDYTPKLDDEGRRLITVIRHNTQNMGRLIDGLLAFSTLGRQPMAHTRIDMTALAHEAFEEVQTGMDTTGVDFQVGRLPEAFGDGVLLRQVFVNILSNAVKFSRGHVHPVVRVEGHAQDGMITYHVTDNGTGFDSKYADKIFGVFQRLHAATEYEGTGLGLAIVQRVIHRHGGTVWADGKVGEGATVYFTLPEPAATLEPVHQ